MSSAKMAWNALVASPGRLAWLAILLVVMASCRAELPSDSGGVVVDAANDSTTVSDAADTNLDTGVDVVAADQEVADSLPDVSSDIDAPGQDGDATAGDADAAGPDGDTQDTGAGDSGPADALSDAGTAPPQDATATGDAADTSEVGDVDTTDSAPDADANSPVDADSADTVDKCKNLKCDDNNQCTSDTCVDGTCSNQPNAKECDDGNECTVGDVCLAGECTATGALACDDNNPCTDDACDKGAGCVHLPAKATCNDLDACTAVDLCDQSTCVGSGVTNCNDNNPCTDDSCDPSKGCVNLANSATCNDASPCTDDSCESSKGCVHLANSATCDDGDACTSGDVCASGACKGAPTSCADPSKPCLTWTCVKATGCVSANATDKSVCSDGTVCTKEDACSGGACVGAAVSCDDANACTDDSCDPQAGCKHAPNKGLCEDGDLCTIGDTCSAAACVAGAAMNCDDSNECTSDTCSKGVCANVAPVKVCDDSNPCTVDACDSTGKKCSHANAKAASVCGDGMICWGGPKCVVGWANSSIVTKATNPIGVWSFGWESGPGDVMTLYKDNSVSGYGTSWYDAAIANSDKIPSIFLNEGTPIAGVATGELSLHGGPNLKTGAPTTTSVLRWTAPKTGAYDVYASFLPGDIGETYASLIAAGIPWLVGAPTSAGVTVQVRVQLAQGAFVEFGVTSPADFRWGSTPVSVRILGKDGAPGTAQSPAKSCKDIKALAASSPSGQYWVQPTTASAAFQVYCDMEADGGGWTLVLSQIGTEFKSLLSQDVTFTHPGLAGGQKNIHELLVDATEIRLTDTAGAPFLEATFDGKAYSDALKSPVQTPVPVPVKYKKGPMAGPQRYTEVNAQWHWGHRNIYPTQGGKTTGLKDIYADDCTHACWEDTAPAFADRAFVGRNCPNDPATSFCQATDPPYVFPATSKRGGSFNFRKWVR